MLGLFGSHTALITDVNLLIQVISFILLFVGLGFKLKKKFKIHGIVMGVAILLHLLFFIVAMWPSFSGGFEFWTTSISLFGVQAMWIHAITGTIVLILGLFLFIAWVLRISNIAACFKRKRIMDVTFALWFISIIFGVGMYLSLYF
jgi:uncharacterized membrane protein YozB (DUF420 family)